MTFFNKKKYRKQNIGELRNLSILHGMKCSQMEFYVWIMRILQVFIFKPFTSRLITELISLQMIVDIKCLFQDLHRNRCLVAALPNASLFSMDRWSDSHRWVNLFTYAQTWIAIRYNSTCTDPVHWSLVQLHMPFHARSVESGPLFTSFWPSGDTRRFVTRSIADNPFVAKVPNVEAEV